MAQAPIRTRLNPQVQTAVMPTVQMAQYEPDLRKSERVQRMGNAIGKLAETVGGIAIQQTKEERAQQEALSNIRATSKRSGLLVSMSDSLQNQTLANTNEAEAWEAFTTANPLPSVSDDPMLQERFELQLRSDFETNFNDNLVKQQRASDYNDGFNTALDYVKSNQEEGLDTNYDAVLNQFNKAGFDEAEKGKMLGNLAVFDLKAAEYQIENQIGTPEQQVAAQKLVAAASSNTEKLSVPELGKIDSISSNGDLQRLSNLQASPTWGKMSPEKQYNTIKKTFTKANENLVLTTYSVALANSNGNTTVALYAARNAAQYSIDGSAESTIGKVDATKLITSQVQREAINGVANIQRGKTTNQNPTVRTDGESSLRLMRQTTVIPDEMDVMTTGLNTFVAMDSTAAPQMGIAAYQTFKQYEVAKGSTAAALEMFTDPNDKATMALIDAQVQMSSRPEQEVILEVLKGRSNGSLFNNPKHPSFNNTQEVNKYNLKFYDEYGSAAQQMQPVYQALMNKFSRTNLPLEQANAATMTMLKSNVEVISPTSLTDKALKFFDDDYIVWNGKALNRDLMHAAQTTGEAGEGGLSTDYDVNKGLTLIIDHELGKWQKAYPDLELPDASQLSVQYTNGQVFIMNPLTLQPLASFTPEDYVSKVVELDPTAASGQAGFNADEKSKAEKEQKVIEELSGEYGYRERALAAMGG